MRMGWTQWDLAERIGVDQGTVSRWERGIENPRPATTAALRDLMLYEDDLQLMKRQQARIMHSIQPALFMDAKTRLQSVNRAGLQNYVDRFDIDLMDHPGVSFEQIAERLSVNGVGAAVNNLGLLSGDLLFLRLYVNDRGAGHVAQYDPVFEAGRLAGISAMIVGTFELPRNNTHSIERIEAVHLDAPDKLVDLYRGPMAKHAVVR